MGPSQDVVGLFYGKNCAVRISLGRAQYLWPGPWAADSFLPHYSTSQVLPSMTQRAFLPNEAQADNPTLADVSISNARLMSDSGAIIMRHSATSQSIQWQQLLQLAPN